MRGGKREAIIPIRDGKLLSSLHPTNTKDIRWKPLINRKSEQMTSDSAIPHFPDFPGMKEDVTAEWLSQVLQANGIAADIDSITKKSIGTGQLGDMIRVSITYREDPPNGAPETLVIKLSSPDPTSRETGVKGGVYEKERNFYREISHILRGKGVGIARCYAAEFSLERECTVLVFEDLAPAEQGDQLKGCSVEEAELGVIQAAKIHAALWKSPILKEKQWLASKGPRFVHQARHIPAFIERYKERLTPDMVAFLNHFKEVVAEFCESITGPDVLTHIDYRNDNVLWTPADQSSTGNRLCYTVDWQTPETGPPGVDIGYFLGGSLLQDDRRAHEKRLVKLYHDELLKRGARDYSLEQAWDHYRVGQISGMMMAVGASMVVVRTERGDEVRSSRLAAAPTGVLSDPCFLLRLADVLDNV